MEKLTLADKKVFAAMDEERFSKGIKAPIPEWPELSVEQVQASIAKLEQLGFFVYDEKIEMYMISEKGEKYLKEHPKEMSPLTKTFLERVEIH